jgi:O-methyltransferase involved in polyketide biosynthesis
MTMKQLTEVSETALITLRSRVVESRKANPLLHDPVGEELFNKLTESLPDDGRHQLVSARTPISFWQPPFLMNSVCSSSELNRCPQILSH